MQNEKMFICVLTVLGLVRFLASVSQLLRWLYVLRLHDINKRDRGYYDDGQRPNVAISEERSGKNLQLLHQDGATMRAGEHQ